MSLRQNAETIKEIFDNMAPEHRQMVMEVFGHLTTLTAIPMSDDDMGRLKTAMMAIAVSLAMRGPEKTIAEVKAVFGLE